MVRRDGKAAEIIVGCARLEKVADRVGEPR